MVKIPNRLVSFAALGVAALAFVACNEKRVDRGPTVSAGTPPAAESTSRSATQQAADRAAAAAQKLQEAQTNASSDQEKEDAVKQYEAERQAIANGTEPQSSGESAPPPR